MTLPLNTSQREHAKFSEVSGVPAVRVDMVQNSGVTTYQGDNPSSIVFGFVSAASGSNTQFATNSIRYLSVKAPGGNTTTVYLGGSTATVTNGYPLAPGDAVDLRVNDTNLLYLVGVGDVCTVRYLAS